jgi:uncharacterized protein YraI
MNLPKMPMRFRPLIPIVTVCALLAGGLLAQDAPTPVPTAGVLLVVTPPLPPTDAPPPTPTQPVTETCADALVGLYVTATESCINKPQGFICNGGAPLGAEPQGGISNALAATGALVEANLVDSIASAPMAPELGTAGIAYLRAPDPLRYTAFLLGDVRIRDVSPPEFPAWTSMIVETAFEPPACPSAPAPMLVVQTPIGYGVRIVINSISLYLNGTALVKIDGTSTAFILLSGVGSALASGSEVAFNVGEQVSVAHAPEDVSVPIGVPGEPRPYDPGLAANLPIALLDRPIVLPQPGYVITQGPVNMRISPGTEAAVVIQVPAGEILSVLGQNAEQTWLHVRRDTGETGWMLAELLGRNTGSISAVYAATPLPPQRYGELGTSGRVIAPAGASLRSGPDTIFPAIVPLTDGQPVTLLARSPYSPWVKVDIGGAIGWLALIALDTQAYIDALPVDYQAPAIPTPTIPPGSFGNAFPDPDGPDN